MTTPTHIGDDKQWWEEYPHLWKILDSTGFPSCEADYYQLVEFIKALLSKEITEARMDELEQMAQQYGEFRDDTTGKQIDLKAVTLYRIEHRIATLKAQQEEL